MHFQPWEKTHGEIKMQDKLNYIELSKKIYFYILNTILQASQSLQSRELKMLANFSCEQKQRNVREIL